MVSRLVSNCVAVHDDLSGVDTAGDFESFAHVVCPQGGREGVCGSVGQLHCLVYGINNGDREHCSHVGQMRSENEIE